MATNSTSIIEVADAHSSSDLPALVKDAQKLNRMHELVASALCADDYPNLITTADIALLHELTWTAGVYLDRIGELIENPRATAPPKPAARVVAMPTRRRKAGAR